MGKCTWWKMWRRMWTVSSLSVSQASTLAISTFLCITESSSSHWRYSSIVLIIIFLPELDVAGFWNKGAWFLITGWWVPTGRGGQESLTGSHLGCACTVKDGESLLEPTHLSSSISDCGSSCTIHPWPGTAPVPLGGPVEVTCPCDASWRGIFIQPEE